MRRVDKDEVALDLVELRFKVRVMGIKELISQCSILPVNCTPSFCGGVVLR